MPHAYQTKDNGVVKKKNLGILKYIYITLIVINIGIATAWCMRYSISYKIAGVKPDLIEERSLTHQEYKALEKATKIRQWCSKIFLYSSLFLFAISILFLRNHWFKPAIIIKVVMIVAGLIALILILANGISFISGPPIR